MYAERGVTEMGQPKAQNVTQTNTVKLGPEQQKLFDLAFPYAEGWAKQPTQLFPGTGIAGFTGPEALGQASALNVAGSTQLPGQAAAAQSKLLDPNFMLNPNQYVQAAADATTGQVTKNLMENILPGIRSGATSAGGMYSGGSSRQGIAEGLAIDRTNAGLSDALSRMYLSNYTAGLGAMGEAVARNPSVLNQQLFPANIYGAVGGQQRAMQQAQLDEQIKNFYAQQDLGLSKSQQLISLLSGMPGGSGVSTVKPAVPQTNPLMQALGIGMQLAGMSMGMPGMGMPGMGMGMGK
jgi:hypothetical protein